jgi:hypothetical protein
VKITANTGAKIAIAAQFAALLRCLGEFFRLQYVLGAQFTVARYEPFVIGSFIAAVGALISVFCALSGKHRTTIGVAIVDVLLLFVVKFVML